MFIENESLTVKYESHTSQGTFKLVTIDSDSNSQESYLIMIIIDDSEFIFTYSELQSFLEYDKRFISCGGICNLCNSFCESESVGLNLSYNYITLHEGCYDYVHSIVTDITSKNKNVLVAHSV